MLKPNSSKGIYYLGEVEIVHREEKLKKHVLGQEFVCNYEFQNMGSYL